MSKTKDEMRAEYRREDLGKGVRGKYLKRYSKGTNLVLLDDKVAKAMRQRQEVLEALREQAIVQSAEPSNRIEGVTVGANRLRPVVLGKARALDRPEEELAGVDYGKS